MSTQELLSDEILEAMGVSRPVYEEVQMVVGHLPSVDELSTLLAMWDSSGRQTGLLTWLKGQFHAAERHDYLGQKEGDQREPKARECLEIARARYCTDGACPVSAATLPSGRETGHILQPAAYRRSTGPSSQSLQTGREIYLVGSVLPSDDDVEFLSLVLESMLANSLILSLDAVGEGGLFGTLLRLTQPLGFDLIPCREIRLDTFLFEEREGRFIVSLTERENALFHQKINEASIPCLYLGRTTSGRVVVDGMDYGPSASFKF